MSGGGLPWTVRVAVWSARHRWPVVVAWFVLTVGMFAASLAAGGTRSAEAVSNDRSDVEVFESREAYDVFNASGETEAPHQFLLIVSDPNGTLEEADLTATVDDVLGRMTTLAATVDGAQVPAFENILDPRQAPPQAGLVSADRTTVRIPAEVPGDDAAVDQRMPAIGAFLADAKAANADMRIHALYRQLVTPVSPYASQLIVLIGLAVAVDYSLFMITRYRTERRAGREKIDAIRVASATAGRAVFFSGLAVIFSIGGLFLLEDELFRSMAIGTIGVVFIAVIGSLTFLPATLALLGDGVDRFRLPFLGRERPEGSGAWAVVVRSVMRHPVVTFVVAAGLLIAIALPAGRLHMGQSDFDSFPDSIDGVQAVNLLDEKWPEGSTLGLQVVVTRADQPRTQVAIADMTERILALDGLGEPVVNRPSTDGTVSMLSYVMSGGRNDERNRALVRQVRADVVPAVFGDLPEVRAYVTGDAAFTLDVVDFYATGMPLVMAFVLGLSFLLLLVAFRSIVIPIKAILLNLLSTAAAFGLLVLVFQDGRFADVLGFKPGPIESFVPVFIFTILFGLSMDYHVFILTRIKEARDRGLSTNEAVARGIAITSGTITSAAAIMIAVFAVFVTLELAIIKQLGFGLATAVLIDATIVRSVLLPATMRLLGEWNWWLPPFLRWLPEVTIEGEVDEPAPDLPPAAVHSPS
jgi:RND superfamily putative drug exporter